MTNLLYFYRVVRDAYSDSSSSQGDVTPQTSQRQTGETSSLYPASSVREEYSRDGESDSISFSCFKRFIFEDLIVITGHSLHYDDCLQSDQNHSDKVFKGVIHNNTETGQAIAVDVILLSQFEKLQDPSGWVGEVKYLQKLSHPNLVRLFGYCLYNDRQLLVYEGMPHTLKNYIYKGDVPWGIRMKIALGAAKGLAFLHSAQVIYRNFRTSYVHLDRNYNAKLSGFGLPKDRLTGDDSHVAPEYPTTGRLTAKSDVYSFGVLLLEILSGRDASKSKEHDLVAWAMPYLDSDILSVLDSNLKGQSTLASAQRVANLTLQCLNTEPDLRPNMVEVIRRLEQFQDSRDVKHKQSDKVRRVLKYFQLTQDSRYVKHKQSDEVRRELEYFQLSQDIETTESESEPEDIEDIQDTGIEDLQDIDDDDIASRQQEQEEYLTFEGR